MDLNPESTLKLSDNDSMMKKPDYLRSAIPMTLKMVATKID